MSSDVRSKASGKKHVLSALKEAEFDDEDSFDLSQEMDDAMNCSKPGLLRTKTMYPEPKIPMLIKRASRLFDKKRQKTG